MPTSNQHLQYWTECANGRRIEVNTAESETSLERAKRLYTEDKISLDVFENRLERIFGRMEYHELFNITPSSGDTN